MDAGAKPMWKSFLSVTLSYHWRRYPRLIRGRSTPASLAASSARAPHDVTQVSLAAPTALPQPPPLPWEFSDHLSARSADSRRFERSFSVKASVGPISCAAVKSAQVAR